MKKIVITLAMSLAAGLMVAPAAAADPVGAKDPITVSIGSVKVSKKSGKEVDRPTYAAKKVTIKGFQTALGATLADYAAQPVTWTACGKADDGAATECADVLVPLDYSNPGAQAITISMRKYPASAAPKLGTLFINPGGPGAPGKDLVGWFDRGGLEQYDIVGWDPRGVGDSTAINKCYTTAKMDALNALDFSWDTQKERQKLVKAAKAFGKACWNKNGSYLNYISTKNTVRDLDLLRQLVGDAKLTYLGYSYGTQIGAFYAEMYGANINRMVLDGAVDIVGNDNVIQAMGFDKALKEYASWCAKKKCGLGKTQSAVIKTIKTWLKELDAKPLKVGKRKLTQTLASLGIGMLLYYGETVWSDLTLYIQLGRKGAGLALLYYADMLNDREDVLTSSNVNKGSYAVGAYAIAAINCIDNSDKGVLASEKRWKKDQKLAPLFGTYFGPDYICPFWPVKSDTLTKITGADAPPLMVIGTTGDNATPYQQAKDMAKALKSATLLTYKGTGHTVYGGTSDCVDKAVVNYLVNGVLSSSNITCSK
ncbi:MAG: alpha/beta hydrolase [Propionibacteriaceae bacterium]|nr:alpha/beta hydrolase [Propionibacteriaceae bacterium]